MRRVDHARAPVGDFGVWAFVYAVISLVAIDVAQAQPFVDVSTQLGPPLAQGIPGQTDLLFAYRALMTGGAVVGDYDGDGDPDVLYTRFGLPDVLYENQGDGTFVDVAAEVGIGGDTLEA